MYSTTTNMAEDRRGSFDRKKAVSLLLEATRFLQHYSSNPPVLNQQRNQQGTEDCVQFASSSSNQNVPPQTRRDRDGESRQSRRVLENCPLFTTTETFRNLKCSNTTAATKIGKGGKEQGIVKPETWTHEFFCLPNRLQVVAPTKSTKQVLQLAGLGRKKLIRNYAT